MSLTFSFRINNAAVLTVEYRYEIANNVETHQIQLIYQYRHTYTTTFTGANVSSETMNENLVTLLKKIDQLSTNNQRQLALKAQEQIMAFLESERNGHDQIEEFPNQFIGNFLGNIQSAFANMIGGGMNPFIAPVQANDAIQQIQHLPAQNQYIRNNNQQRYARNNNVPQNRIINNPNNRGNMVIKPDLQVHLKKQQEKKRRIDYNFFKQEDIMDELKCENCKRYYFNPMKLSCGDTFCQTCVEELKKNKSKCPVCDKELNHQLTGKDMMVVWTLEEMEVYCPNKVEKKCAWVGAIKLLDDH